MLGKNSTGGDSNRSKKDDRKQVLLTPRLSNL